jgi:hypothetical protein
VGQPVLLVLEQLRRRSRAAGALAVSAVLLLSGGCGGSGGKQLEAVKARDFRGGAWRALPEPPGGQTSASQGALATVADTLYVMVVPHSDSQHPDASVWRYTGERWEGPVGGPLKVDEDNDVQFIGGDRVCLASTLNRVPTVRCLAGDEWEALGGPVYKPGPYTVLDSFFDAGGTLYVVGTDLLDPHVESVGVSGRSRETLYSFRNGRWDEVPGASIDRAQRAAGFAAARGEPCVVADLLGRSRATVGMRCVLDGRWRHAAPLLHAPGHHPFDVDGVAVAGRRVYLGIDRFGNAGVDWPVKALHDGRWRDTRLGASSRRWQEQGTLLATGPQVIALRFDQRRTKRALLGRFVVRALATGTGRTHRLGGPLVAPSPLYSTVSTSLAATGDTLYALYSVPNRSTHQNELVVSRLASR